MLAGISRSSFAYDPIEKDDSEMIKMLKKISKKHPREGSRKAYEKLRRKDIVVNHKKVEKLRRKDIVVNHKKVERLWQENGLTVPVKRSWSFCSLYTAGRFIFAAITARSLSL